MLSKENRKNWDNHGKRGGFDYYPPYGWIGIGLNVKGKYDNGNNDWISNGNKNEWAIAYHGIKNENCLRYIISTTLKIQMISVIMVKK